MPVAIPSGRPIPTQTAAFAGVCRHLSALLLPLAACLLLLLPPGWVPPALAEFSGVDYTLTNQNEQNFSNRNLADTSFAGATPATTQATAPRSAVTASGSASVNQSTITAATMTASRCASGESSMRRV